MKNDLLFDFTVDKATHTVTVNREFDAGRSLVWDAFTKQEILDQWWAPQPWQSKTRYMDFKVGGRRFYAMVGPQGEEHWAIQEFTSINPTTHFSFFDAFADKEENINTDLPGADWDLDFHEKEGTTTVNILIRHKSLDDLEKIIAMGFKEGFTMTLDYLGQMLTQQNGLPAPITIRAMVNAPKDKAWEYYTSPQHITHWNFASEDWQCPSANNDLRVGGTYKARMEAKDGSMGFDFEAVYDEIVEGEKLSFKLTDERQVQVWFREAEDKTEVIVSFVPESENPRDLQQNGWQAILDNYKTYTETH